MSATTTRAPRTPAAPPVGAPAPPPTRRSLLALLRRGLRDQARAPLTWGAGLGALGALMAAIWPSIEGSMEELMRSYPESLKQAFGIQRLDSVERYVDAEMLSLIVPFAAAFFVVRCVTRATVGAEDRGHLDTLLSLPVSRRVVVGAAYGVAGAALATVLAVFWGMTWVAGTIAGTGISATTLGAGALNVWPLAMAFGGLAALLAGVLHRPAAVTGLASGAVVAMYVIDLLGKLSDPLRPIRAVSAFRYYGSAIQDGFDVSHAVALTLVGVALTVVGALLFERRDVL
ncbi:MAG TPA: ABC transporter permease subunit [Baekduia sp.]|nr:ABC transporter permease subunit [Baekduia sp.]